MPRRRFLVVRISILLAFAGVLGPVAVPSLLAEEDADSSPGYVVVLTDGTVLPVLTEPVIAFGKVRFMSASQRTEVLSARQVDLGRTRKLNSLVPRQGPPGTFSVAGASSGTRQTDSGGASGPRVASQTGSSPTEKTRDRRPRSVKVYSATWCPHCQT